MRTLVTGSYSVSPLTYNGRGLDTYLTLGQRYEKNRDINFVDDHILIIFHEFQIDRVQAMSMVFSQTFLR